MERAAVLEKVSPLVDGEMRHYKDSSGVRIQIDGKRLTVRPKRSAPTLEVEKPGFKSMLQFAHIPPGLDAKVSPDTFTRVLNDILGNVGKFSLVVKDDTITSMIPYMGENGRAVNTERLLDIVEKIIPSTEYHRVLVDNERKYAHLEILGIDQKPVVRGDLVRAGVNVSFSPLGSIAPSVKSFAVRLVCTNGATNETVLSEFTGGRGGDEGDSVWQFFRESIRKAYRSSDKVVEGWQKLAHDTVKQGERAAMLEALIKAAKIGGEQADAVRAMAIENPPRNAWEMMNLITFASSHLLSTPRAVSQAQGAASEYASTSAHAKRCPLCHSAN